MITPAAWLHHYKHKAGGRRYAQASIGDGDVMIGPPPADGFVWDSFEPLYDQAAMTAAVAAERERWATICREHAADTAPPHKPHEGYADGWTDACNEILWAGTE